MINLGMDFGSTYTMVSILENGEPRTVQSSHLMFHYPSIVCYDEDKNKYFYGTSARERLGKKGIVGFRGFKMLLNEQMNPQMLRERNYSDKHTPEFITSFFLRSVLENTLKKLGED
ncbi:MAG: Hsp70 family protein, partial [Ruminococcus sp.]|nr:Hsp70 family protein [Ruminococcus sp.]